MAPGGYLSSGPKVLAHLRELSQCLRALTEIIIPKQARKMNLDMFLVPFQKKGWKIDHHVSNLTPVAGPIFETKNRAIFLERFFGRGITAREQLSRAVILARF